MAKDSAFFCSECGYESSKWQGQCPSCRAWNTFVEAPKEAKTKKRSAAVSSLPVLMKDIKTDDDERVLSGYKELDRVLGGGLVRGSLVLVGGDPGIGKSTLLLQACGRYIKGGQSVLYVSGEESLRQIKLRSDRLKDSDDMLSLLCETDLGIIEEQIKENKPDIVVIDSIQTMYCEQASSLPGSVSQIRESTATLLRLGKSLGITIFLVGHVTKEGLVAGPKILEHMVDTVLYFEGERSASYRILRAVKNRFGSTDEIGVFEMGGEGLSEVENPSEFLLSGRPTGVSGSVVTASMEGTRPVLLEIQALVSKTNFGNPRRSGNGVDSGRMNLLVAVLEKRLGLPLYEFDAYLNVTGGMKVAEPAMDVGIAAAIISSFRDVVVDSKTILFGEIGLTGEIRSVSGSQQRINEASKLGFNRCVLPAVSLKGLNIPSGMNCIGVNNVYELMSALL
ncbi:MAG: DNA repair protein RadA [Lachnospiraceae bacterium]|nr:DNA repair protein RadA [Lachnospiraceae bacterium]MBR4586973.1 DNA repair protein RadA [Lachnospiraceae bacterium]